MTSNVLPIGKPFIYGYKHHAVPFTLFSLHDESLPWISSNYIQLFVHKYKEDRHWLDFYVIDRLHQGTNPFFRVDNLDRSTMLKLMDPIDFIIKCIDLNNYVYLWGDQFYIPHSEVFKKEHITTNFMIYGYDKKEKYFMITDYSFKWQFESVKLSFSDFVNAFLSKDVIWRWESTINLLRPVQNSKYNFNINLVTQLINDYLSGENHVDQCSMLQVPWRPVAYGIHVYQYLYQYLDSAFEQKSRISILPFHLLWEHKKVILSLINYLIVHNYIHDLSKLVDRYMEVERTAFAFRNSIMKFRRTNDWNIVKRLTVKIKNIESIEHDVLSEVLDQLLRKVAHQD